MGGRVYLSSFKKIGPVMVQITNDSALLLSVLGARSYTFKHMPSNYDNKYAILKLSMKHYFAEMADGCKTPRARKHQTPVSQLLGFFFSKPQLEYGGDAREMLCCEVRNNPRHYDWERVDGFLEYKGTEDVLRCLQKCPVVCFLGFEDGFLADSETAKEIDQLQIDCKPDGDCTEITRYFLNNEIGYLAKMAGYRSRFVSDERVAGRKIDFSCFLEVLKAHETLLRRFIAGFGTGGLTEEQCDLLSGTSAEISGVLAARGGLDGGECSIADIVAFLDENFDLFFPYEGFIARFDGIMERNADLAELRDCFTTVVQKITGYSQVCKSFLRYQNSRGVKLLYLRFLRYNRKLNRIAENIYLRNIRHRLLERCALGRPGECQESAVFGRSKLQAKISCPTDSNKSISMCVFDKFVFLFKDEFEYLAHLDLQLADVYVFDKKMFLFVERDGPCSSLFRKIGSSSLWYLVLQCTSRESVNEFREAFYRTKYGSEPSGNRYCRQDGGQPCDILVTNVCARRADAAPGQTMGGKVSLARPADRRCSGDQASKTEGGADAPPPGDKLYNVMIEHSDLRIGGTSQLTENEINLRVEKLFEVKIDQQMKSTSFLLKLKAVLENISKTRLEAFSLYAYNEDDVPFKEKDSIFHYFIEALHSHPQMTDCACGTAPGAEEAARARATPALADPQTQRDRFYSNLLYENDILKRYCPGDIITYLTQYIFVLNGSGRSCRVLKNTDLKTTVLLFSMFWQRNLYVFLSPDDLSRFSLCLQNGDYQNAVACVSPRNRPYLSKVLGVCKAVYSGDKHLARVILIPFLDGDITDHILHKILNAC